MRRVLGAMVAVSALEVVAALLLLPWTWTDYHREHDELAVYLTTLFVGHAATAGLLLLAGRGDQRTWLLGAYFLLKATLAPLHMFYASLWEIPPHVIEGFLLESAGPGQAARLPLCAPVPVRTGVPVGVRSRVSPGTAPHPSRRPGAAHGPGQRGGELPQLGRGRGVVRARLGGVRDRGAVRGPRCQLRCGESVGAGGGRRRLAARALGGGRRSEARPAVSAVRSCCTWDRR